MDYKDIAENIPFGLLELAKHAPAEPQPWFKPEMPPKPEKPKMEFDLDAEETPPEWDAFLKKDREWLEEHTKARIFQWPLAWAKGVLEAGVTLGLVVGGQYQFDAINKENGPQPAGTEDYLARIALTKALTVAVGFARHKRDSILTQKWIDVLHEYGVFKDGEVTL